MSLKQYQKLNSIFSDHPSCPNCASTMVIELTDTPVPMTKKAEPTTAVEEVEEVGVDICASGTLKFVGEFFCWNTACFRVHGHVIILG